MSKVVRLNHLMNAVRVETPITIPIDGGEILVIARNGDFCFFNEESEFVKIVDSKKFAEDYVSVDGDR